MKYVQVEKENVLSELNGSSKLYMVDIPTQRVVDCATMTIGAVISFIDKPEAMFFKEVANE